MDFRYASPEFLIKLFKAAWIYKAYVESTKPTSINPDEKTMYYVSLKQDKSILSNPCGDWDSKKHHWTLEIELSPVRARRVYLARTENVRHEFFYHLADHACYKNDDANVSIILRNRVRAVHQGLHAFDQIRSEISTFTQRIIQYRTFKIS